VVSILAQHSRAALSPVKSLIDHRDDLDVVCDVSIIRTSRFRHIHHEHSEKSTKCTGRQEGRSPVGFTSRSQGLIKTQKGEKPVRPLQSRDEEPRRIVNPLCDIPRIEGRQPATSITIRPTPWNSTSGRILVLWKARYISLVLLR
jgi:hypothetical protein